MKNGRLQHLTKLKSRFQVAFMSTPKCSSKSKLGSVLISLAIFLALLSMQNGSRTTLGSRGSASVGVLESADEVRKIQCGFSAAEAIAQLQQSIASDPNESRVLRELFDRDFKNGILLEARSQLTIFCAPKPYTSSDQDPQRRALMSWLRLSPPANIVLLGDDPTFFALQSEFAGRITVEPHVDSNFRHCPQFHSMLARAQAASTHLSMLINGDIILLNDLMPVVRKVASRFHDFIITAARWDVSDDFPFSFRPSDRGPGGTNETFDADVRGFVRKNGKLHTTGGIDLWLWNNSPRPLHSVAMPPFTFGRGKYDNWLIHEAVASNVREVVDASESLTSIHVQHAYAHVLSGQGAGDLQGKNFWSVNKQESWELYSNIHLAQAHGSYTNQKGTALHAPWRLATCDEPAVSNLCMLKRPRPSNCSCEYSAYVERSLSDPKLTNGRIWACGTVSIDKAKDFAIPTLLSNTSKPGLPHTKEQLLPQVAKEVDGHRIVTLVAVTFEYRDILMNFVCNLRSLGLAGNLLVAALDEQLYQFAFTQGLAVYYEQKGGKVGSAEVGGESCPFGSQCFRAVTKLKSRAVLGVLRAGYSVLWTDVDIVWFRDPLPHLMSFGKGTLPIQSNEPNATKPGTGIRRINSGFYFARSDQKTVQAFEAVTAHAAKTRLSEQPSFYDVLCGEKGELLSPAGTDERCTWHNGLVTVFLDRTTYPNGAVYNFWGEENVRAACQAKGCAILHNNWILGSGPKKERLAKHGFWQYDIVNRMCMYSWHSRVLPFDPVFKANCTTCGGRALPP